MKKPYFLVSAFLLLLSAFLVAELVCYSRNTLSIHPEWVSGKRLLAAPVMGSWGGVSKRNLLHRNRLNLHAWHGFNEILFSRLLRPASMEFSFSLEPRSYVCVLFNMTHASYSGFRLSRSPHFPSIFFRADADGRFLFKSELQGLSLSKSTHRARVVFQDNSVSLQVDGACLGYFDDGPVGEQIMGFRSGYGAVVVDDVRITDIHGNVVKEGFRNTRGYWCMFVWAVLLTGAVAALVAGIGRVFRLGRKRIMGLMLFLQWCFVVAAGAYYSADYLFWSSRYYYRPHRQWQGSTSTEKLSMLERLRESVFSAVASNDCGGTKEPEPEAGTELADFLKREPDTRYRPMALKVIQGLNGKPRISILEDSAEAVKQLAEHEGLSAYTKVLFLGTSQMWGSGATFPEHRIAVQTFENLSNYFSKKTEFIVINASKRGSNGEELCTRYVEYLSLFEPDVVVVNLGNNDPVHGYEQTVRSILEAVLSKGRHAMLVLEANASEAEDSRLRKKHMVMAELAQEYGIPCVDLHANLAHAHIYDSGFLWWDRVHLTSYGQEVAADLISGALVENFQSKGVAPASF